MATHPSDPLDRIAELEAQLASVTRRQRPAATAAERTDRQAVWAARTCERDDGTYPAQGETRIPVVTREWKEISGVWQLVDRTADSGYPVPSIEAFCPLTWLPPLVDVEIALDRRGWRIIRWPAMLHGRASGSIAGSEWVSGYAACGAYQLGTGTVRVYRPATVAGPDEPQSYRDGSPVNMTVYNTSDEAVTAQKLLSLVPDGVGRWITTIEPCGGVCPDYS